jgi:exodeoxyribonuclease VII small subunit
MGKSSSSYEAAIEELEGIIEKMEKGEMTLDESVKFFQRGIELSKFCSKKLDEVERKITILLEKSDGETEEKDFMSADD